MLANGATPPSLQMLMAFSPKGIYIATLTGEDTKLELDHLHLWGTKTEIHYSTSP